MAKRSLKQATAAASKPANNSNKAAKKQRRDEEDDIANRSRHGGNKSRNSKKARDEEEDEDEDINQGMSDYFVVADEADDADEDDEDEFGEFDDLEDENKSDNESDPGEEELEDISNRLMSAIDKFSASSAGNNGNNSVDTQQMQESSFGLDTDAVSMNALLDALSNTRGISAVRKSLNDLEKSIEAPKYVEKVVSERMERNLTYKDKQSDMTKWQAQVIENRNAKTLDLVKDNKRDPQSYRSLVAKYTPQTDLEKDVQMVMVKCGLTESAAAKTENELLMGHGMSLKEIKQRQAELAKVKALMFYEQMKRHRLNKIKSKAYRRIRKRQKKRADAKNGVGEQGGDEESDAESSGAESEEDAEEEIAARRARERMDLRHQNTGKWAHMAKQRGQYDKSLK
jgi:U3 small nucleolar RNA-associated protein 14